MSGVALRELYRSIWPSVAALPTDQGLSLPLLISLADTYPIADLRLLVVGQETQTWYGLLGQELGDDPVERVLSRYAQFNLGAGYPSPFWDAIRKVTRLLGTPEKSVGLAWSNLYPCDQNGDRPGEPLGQALLDMRILPSEVKILDPHAVVFFTGPDYDSALTYLFPSANRADVGASKSQRIHRVEHPDLPTASFRTYHPGYLRRQKQEAAIGTIVDLIKASLATRSDRPAAS